MFASRSVTCEILIKLPHNTGPVFLTLNSKLLALPYSQLGGHYITTSKIHRLIAEFNMIGLLPELIKFQ